MSTLHRGREHPGLCVGERYPVARSFLPGRPVPPQARQEYPEAQHTLEFEPHDHPWVADVIRWIGEQVV